MREQGALSGKYNKENPLPVESDRGKKYNPVLPQLEALTDEMKAIGEKHNASCSQVGIAGLSPRARCLLSVQRKSATLSRLPRPQRLS